MLGIYCASKDYIEAPYMEAYRAFWHAKTEEEHDKQKLALKMSTQQSAGGAGGATGYWRILRDLVADLFCCGGTLRRSQR